MKTHTYLGNPIDGKEEIPAYTAICEFLASVKNIDTAQLDQLGQERYRQLHFLAVYSKTRIEQLNLDFLGGNSSGSIDYIMHNLTSQIQAAKKQLNNVQVDTSVQNGLQHLRNTILPQLHHLPTSLPDNEKTEFIAIKENAEFFIQVSQKVIENANVFNEKMGELTKAIKEQEVRIEGQLREISEEASRRLNLNEGAFKETLSNLITNATNEVNKAQTDLAEQKKEADRVTQVLAIKGVAEGYAEQAEAQYRSYTTWRRSAVWCFGIGALIAAIAVIFINNKLEWYEYGPKLLSSLVMLLPGFYAAREAEKHRKISELYRKLNLEFVTLGPYLNDLPIEDKNKIKQDLINQYFTGSKISGEQTESLDSTELELLKKLVEAARELPVKILDKLVK